jgi:hypothetical protein
MCHHEATGQASTRYDTMIPLTQRLETRMSRASASRQRHDYRYSPDYGCCMPKFIQAAKTNHHHAAAGVPSRVILIHHGVLSQTTTASQRTSHESAVLSLCSHRSSSSRSAPRVKSYFLSRVSHSYADAVVIHAGNTRRTCQSFEFAAELAADLEEAHRTARLQP